MSDRGHVNRPVRSGTGSRIDASRIRPAGHRLQGPDIDSASARRRGRRLQPRRTPRPLASTGMRRPPGRSTRFASSRWTAATSTISATCRSTSTATVHRHRPDRLFARRIVWLKNPGKRGAPGPSARSTGRPDRVRVLVDLDNAARRDRPAAFTGGAKTPQTWYEVVEGTWRALVRSQSYRHGIGAGTSTATSATTSSPPSARRSAGPGLGAAAMDVARSRFGATLRQSAPPRRPPGRRRPLSTAPPAGRPQSPRSSVHAPDRRRRRRPQRRRTTMAHCYGVLWFEQQAEGAVDAGGDRRDLGERRLDGHGD